MPSPPCSTSAHARPSRGKLLRNDSTDLSRPPLESAPWAIQSGSGVLACPGGVSEGARPPAAPSDSGSAQGDFTLVTAQKSGTGVKP